MKMNARDADIYYAIKDMTSSMMNAAKECRKPDRNNDYVAEQLEQAALILVEVVDKHYSVRNAATVYQLHAVSTEDSK